MTGARTLAPILPSHIPPREDYPADLRAPASVSVTDVQRIFGRAAVTSAGLAVPREAEIVEDLWQIWCLDYAPRVAPEHVRRLARMRQIVCDAMMEVRR